MAICPQGLEDVVGEIDLIKSEREWQRGREWENEMEGRGGQTGEGMG